MSYVFVTRDIETTSKDDGSAMKTITESKIIYEFSSLENLIEKLCKIRSEVNGYVAVCLSGSSSTGYTVICSWERDMTDEELKRDAEYEQKSIDAAREMRRKEYEKLKTEFEHGSNEQLSENS